MSSPVLPRPQVGFVPDPAHVERVRDERNDAVSIEYLRLAVEALKGRDATPHQIADCADVLWEWSQSDTWERKR